LGEQPGLTPELVFKLTAGAVVKEDLRTMTLAASCPVHFVARASSDLWRRIRAADVVHALNPSPDVVLAAKLLRKPVVVTVFNRWQPGCSLHRLLWRIGARVADRCCYISQYVWDTWEPRAKRACSERVVAVSELPEGEIPVERRRGFCFVGRWVENKGLEELVAAYAAAQISREACPLILLGDGPLRPRIEQLIQKHGAAGITIRGFVDATAKAEIMRNSRWIVAPHRTHEDLGLAPIEGRAVGVPSIVTRDGGLPEAAGDTALVCEPGDVPALTALLERAASMPASEYADRSRRCRETLPELIRPLSHYTAIYEALSPARAKTEALRR
jgi:glycosyltransferase involved in cell wall biosynthesis